MSRYETLKKKYAPQLRLDRLNSCIEVLGLTEKEIFEFLIAKDSDETLKTTQENRE